MAARAGIVWISTNLLDAQQVCQGQHHRFKHSPFSALMATSPSARRPPRGAASPPRPHGVPICSAGRHRGGGCRTSQPANYDAGSRVLSAERVFMWCL